MGMSTLAGNRIEQKGGREREGKEASGGAEQRRSGCYNYQGMYLVQSVLHLPCGYAPFVIIL